MPKSRTLYNMPFPRTFCRRHLGTDIRVPTRPPIIPPEYSNGSIDRKTSDTTLPATRNLGREKRRTNMPQKTGVSFYHLVMFAWNSHLSRPVGKIPKLETQWFCGMPGDRELPTARKQGTDSARPTGRLSQSRHPGRKYLP